MLFFLDCWWYIWLESMTLESLDRYFVGWTGFSKHIFSFMVIGFFMFFFNILFLMCKWIVLFFEVIYLTTMVIKHMREHARCNFIYMHLYTLYYVLLYGTRLNVTLAITFLFNELITKYNVGWSFLSCL